MIAFGHINSNHQNGPAGRVTPFYDGQTLGKPRLFKWSTRSEGGLSSIVDVYEVTGIASATGSLDRERRLAGQAGLLQKAPECHASGEKAPHPDPSPWRQIPDWFYDNCPLAGNRRGMDYSPEAYSQIQKFFGKNISPRAIREFLFGDAIAEMRLTSLEVWYTNSNELSARATLRTPDRKEAYIDRSFNREEKTAYFELMKVIGAHGTFPEGFAREYFRRVIPALRELGIRSIETHPYSDEYSGFSGAYVWCRYGYTNLDMERTLSEYIDYLEQYRGVYLDDEQKKDIMKIRRMRQLADEDIDGIRYGRDFLLGKMHGSCDWYGIIPDINDESSDEMDELIDHLKNRQRNR